jgi:hypothetical protein
VSCIDRERISSLPGGGVFSTLPEVHVPKSDPGIYIPRVPGEQSPIVSFCGSKVPRPGTHLRPAESSVSIGRVGGEHPLVHRQRLVEPACPGERAGPAQRCVAQPGMVIQEAVVAGNCGVILAVPGHYPCLDEPYLGISWSTCSGAA